MALVLWLWFLAMLADFADFIPDQPQRTAKYKTLYIEQPVSMN